MGKRRPREKGGEGSPGGRFLRAALWVLSEEKRYMDNRQLTSCATAKGYLKGLKGRTPHHTMAAALYTDVKKNKCSKFIRPAEGIFGLREWATNNTLPYLGKVCAEKCPERNEPEPADTLPPRKRRREEPEDEELIHKPPAKKRGRPLGWRKHGPNVLTGALPKSMLAREAAGQTTADDPEETHQRQPLRSSSRMPMKKKPFDEETEEGAEIETLLDTPGPSSKGIDEPELLRTSSDSNEMSQTSEELDTSTEELDARTIVSTLLLLAEEAYAAELDASISSKDNNHLNYKKCPTPPSVLDLPESDDDLELEDEEYEVDVSEGPLVKLTNCSGDEEIPLDIELRITSPPTTPTMPGQNSCQYPNVPYHAPKRQMIDNFHKKDKTSCEQQVKKVSNCILEHSLARTEPSDSYTPASSVPIVPTPTNSYLSDAVDLKDTQDCLISGPPRSPEHEHEYPPLSPNMSNMSGTNDRTFDRDRARSDSETSPNRAYASDVLEAALTPKVQEALHTLVESGVLTNMLPSDGAGGMAMFMYFANMQKLLCEQEKQQEKQQIAVSASGAEQGPEFVLAKDDRSDAHVPKRAFTFPTPATSHLTHLTHSPYQ